MKVARATLALVTMVVSVVLGTVVSVTPAHAADERRTLTSKIETRDAAAMAAAAARGDQAVVTPNAIPDAYRVCGSKKCIWVERTRYCPPDTGCGQRVVMRPWSGGYCSSSVGCATINGRNYHVTTATNGDNWTREEVSKVVQCGAGVGLVVVDFWTRGFTKLALAGAGLTAWGCST